MPKRLKARYKAIWLQAMLPGFQLYEDDHRQVAADAFDEVWFSRWYPLYFCVPVTMVYAGAQVLLLILMGEVLGSGSINWPMLIIGLPVGIVLLLGAVVGLDLLIMLAIRPLLQRAIRRAIRRRGHEICMACGYFLRGVPAGTDVCPECGAPRQRLAPPTSLLAPPPVAPPLPSSPPPVPPVAPPTVPPEPPS